MRRVILSQYLLIINDSGYIPPAETGLTCNSWYGKAHLEMHYWHMAWAALWGHPELLERSFDWYISILPEAEKMQQEMVIRVQGGQKWYPIQERIVRQKLRLFLYGSSLT